MKYFLFLEDLRCQKKELVGTKSSSLSFLFHEFKQQSIVIPLGFCTTATAFTDFIDENNIKKKISELIEHILNTSYSQAKKEKCARKICSLIEAAEFNDCFIDELTYCYNTFLKNNPTTTAFAIRSSSTHEDLEEASFAGQQETFLNIFSLHNVLSAIKKVFASFYSHSVISYKTNKGIHAETGAMCICIQQMIEARSSGVMFTADPHTGFGKVISISANYGLGESVVQGIINPDEYIVYKNHLAIIQKNFGNKTEKTEIKKTKIPGRSTKIEKLNSTEKKAFALSEETIKTIAAIGVEIEKKYQLPLDIEWIEEKESHRIFILQARPITTIKQKEEEFEISYRVEKDPWDHSLISGKAIGTQAIIGRIKVCHTMKDAIGITKDDILVTRMTDPSWEPMMKRAGGIITDLGGRTCHAAIIARELGIPTIVGCTNATQKLIHNQLVTLSCSEGENGVVFAGEKKITIEKTKKAVTLETVKTKFMLNIGNPEVSFASQRIPNHGVGLARMEFIISSIIKIHPKAALHYSTLPIKIQSQIKKVMKGYSDPVTYYVEKLVQAISTIAASFFPKKMILRLSDFKTNEYKLLIGGKIFEHHEENPMLGFRGAARYISPAFKECFALECLAIKKTRDELKFKNIEIMVPFVRTIEEAKQVTELLASHGLKREDGLRIIMMCEIPANALLAEEFLAYFDGFSIGSNDMTQLTLGVDRDSNKNLHALFDEKNEAVKKIVSMAIQACKKLNKYIGICGQAPSDHPDFALWLINQGIETISLNPDSVYKLQRYLAENNTINF